MVSISVRNNTIASFYARHGRRASLLVHPYGVKALRCYMDQLSNAAGGRDVARATSLADALNRVCMEKEPPLSTELREALKDLWCSDDGYVAVAGEKEETVEGILSQQSAVGDPDVVVRMGVMKIALLIIEVSVDSNGGEKKVGQAFDYASLIKNPNETFLLLTLHFDRTQEDYSLKAVQEAFLYLHSEHEDQRKLGFLWREAYAAAETKSVASVVESTSEGIVRCLNCAKHIDSLGESQDKWDLVSDNVAIENDRYVYKIFDNRFHPTYRKPDNWLQSEYPWIKHLNVETYLEFQETKDSIDTLGKPTRKRKCGDESPKTVPYPRGSVLIIRYKYLNGTHFASRVSHFKAIADWITEMHKRNIVHGDIRGFNMLHPHPETVPGGIEQSCLIDFDLSGTPEDFYPPGFSPRVTENQYKRSGKENSKMEKDDDWKELASAMSPYIAARKLPDETSHAWENLCLCMKRNPLPKSGEFAGLIDRFIEKHGDIEIALSRQVQESWEDEIIKGTGSPNKKKQKSRGSTTIST